MSEGLYTTPPGSLIPARNVVIVPSGFPSGPTPDCAHEWRVNPVVCATNTGADCELWLCLRCGVQASGPPLGRYPETKPTGRVSPFDPSTWRKRP